MDLNITDLEGTNVSLQVLAGEVLFVVGSNGSGKSSLLFKWSREVDKVVFLTGNRDILFDSSAIEVSAAQAKQYSEEARHYYQDPQFRYRRGYHNGKERLKSILFLLKVREDYCNSEYVQADKRGDENKKKEISKEMPLDIVNAAMRSGGLRVFLKWDENAALIVEKNGRAESYGMNALSDGERAALILVIETILAEVGSLIMIDEPERHLHRAISAPLLTFLRAVRPDLGWVLATHDLSLLRDIKHSKVLALYDFASNRWRFGIVSGALPGEIVDAVFGARECILFVEGSENSLDFPLYQILFPKHAIIAAGNRDAVEKAVMGMSAVAGLHHLRCNGLVDFDNRNDQSKLQEKGIFVLDVYAVESLYYCTEVISAMLDTAGTKSTFDDVVAAAIGGISDDDVVRLARDAAYKSFANDFLRLAPSFDEFDKGGSVRLPDGKSIHEDMLAHLLAVKNSGNWDEVVAVFKIKATKAPSLIAKKLGFSKAEAYEIAVRKKLIIEPDLAKKLRLRMPRELQECSPLQRPDPHVPLLA